VRFTRLTTSSSPTAEHRSAPCMAGGKAAVEAGNVTCGAVRCSEWLGPLYIRRNVLKRLDKFGDFSFVSRRFR